MPISRPSRERLGSVPNAPSYSRPSASHMPSTQADPESDSHPDDKDMDSWRLALLGDGGVGKTALAVQFCLNAFVETYDPTIEDAYRKATKVGPQRCFIEIIDTAGQEEYAPVRDQWTWETAAFVLVFSIGSYKSFDRLKLFYNIVTRVQRKDPIVIVVGNKLDQKRVVPAQAGIEFARSIKATYIETSAKTAHNVPLVFTEPITRLRNRHAHVSMRYELKGRLITGPKNAQSIEVPASAIAAVAASEARRAASGRRTSDENRELGQQGPILEGPMPLNQMVARMWPDGQTENPPGYSHQGLILPGLYESDAPGATYGSGGMGAGMYASPRNSSSQPSGLNGNGAGGGGLTTPRNGTRSRSGTNASMTQMPNMNGTWSSASTGGSMGMPPVPGRNPQYPRANHIAEDSRPGRKMSDPSSGSRGPPGYGGGGSRPSPPPHHLPPPSSSRQPDKKKGGLFGKKNSKKDKDDKCLIM